MQLAVIVTADLTGTMDLTVATLGSISKKDIKSAVGNRIHKESILCGDGHVSYKGFAKDNNLSLIVLRADLKQYVKQEVYYIQNINFLHLMIKKWIDSTFWGVSTKYLQNYLNWYRIIEFYKNSMNEKQDIINCSTEDMLTLDKYKMINQRYQNIIAMQN